MRSGLPVSRHPCFNRPQRLISADIKYWATFYDGYIDGMVNVKIVRLSGNKRVGSGHKNSPWHNMVSVRGDLTAFHGKYFNPAVSGI